jgi:hypothetical protein
MTARLTGTAAIAMATRAALAACGKSTETATQADTVVRDWIVAATSKDGEAYCGRMTAEFLQKTMGKRGEMATKTCEKQVNAGSGDYPFQFDIPKPTAKGAGAAEVSASGKKLRGRIEFKKQRGKLLVDAVR